MFSGCWVLGESGTRADQRDEGRREKNVDEVFHKIQAGQAARLPSATVSFFPGPKNPRKHPKAEQQSNE